MQVSKEELLHIANLSKLELKNLDDILEFANIINNVHTDDLDITIGANAAKNVFRKDEIKIFEDNEALLQNASSKENHMFKVPKII